MVPVSCQMPLIWVITNTELRKKGTFFISQRFLILKEKLKHRLLLSNLSESKVQTFQFKIHTHT